MENDRPMKDVISREGVLRVLICIIGGFMNGLGIRNS